MPEQEYRGKIAIVTGAAQGIGAAVVLAYPVDMRNSQAIAEAVEQIEAGPGCDFGQAALCGIQGRGQSLYKIPGAGAGRIWHPL